MAGLMMTACVKESANEQMGLPEGAMMLTTEGFQGHNTKTSVSGTTVQWVGDGTESVTLNGTAYTVGLAGGNAYVNASSEIKSGEAYGHYGFSGNPSWNSSTKKLSATVPSEYTSYYDGAGRQVIALPMVAYKDGAADVIEFKHVTAAVLVRVKNTTGSNLTLDSVIVASDYYKLCGSSTFTLTSEDFAISPTSGTSTTKRVKVSFLGQPTIETGGLDIKEIQVPILPTASRSNDLTIKVYAHKPSGESVSIEGVPSVQKLTSYNFSKTDNTPALSRNKMITAQFEIKSTTATSTIDCSLFSVASGKTIRFSKGNLQYIGSNATPYWKFADNQYGVIDNNSQCSDATNIDRDLFGWGTSGYNEKYPYMVSTTGSDYGNGSGVNIAGTEYDWGVHNPISNGGNLANLWRTLTDAEWTYLLKTRSNAASKYGFAQVNGVNGLVILPDFFADPKKNNGSSAFVPVSTPSDWTDNIYTAANWSYMEASGAIFLPVAGRRNGISYNATYAIRGYYWSATASTTSAKGIYFYKATAGNYSTSLSTSYSDGRYYGFSVRLVKDVE